MTQASADVEATTKSSGTASTNNDTPDEDAIVEEGTEASAARISSENNTENMIIGDLPGHDFTYNGDLSNVQDFTPDDYNIFDEAMTAALHSTPTLNSDTMAVASFRNHSFSLSAGASNDRQDMNFDSTQTWQRHGDKFMTPLQTRPVSMPVSIKPSCEKEWDTGDFLGNEL